MPKTAPDAVMDAAFDYIDQADVMHVCSTLDATPTYAEIVSASLADVAMTPNTDFTKAAGDTSGRKVTVAAKSSVNVDASGTANHIALVTVSGSVVRYVTTCTSQALTSGNTVNIPAWDIEIAAAT
jgi:hypothetical protein